MNNWVIDLLNEYRMGRNKLRKLYKSLNEDDPERKIVGSMYRDMTFVIEWLETGRMPGKMKGIDKKDVYTISLGEKQQKTSYGINGYWDESMGAFITPNNYTDSFLEVEERMDRQSELKKRIYKALMSLTERERECFYLYSTQNMDPQKISEELGVSMGAVRNYINRAKRKIKQLT